jgi:hypothetical protein
VEPTARGPSSSSLAQPRAIPVLFSSLFVDTVHTRHTHSFIGSPHHIDFTTPLSQARLLHQSSSAVCTSSWLPADERQVVHAEKVPRGTLTKTCFGFPSIPPLSLRSSLSRAYARLACSPHSRLLVLRALALRRQVLHPPPYPLSCYHQHDAKVFRVNWFYCDMMHLAFTVFYFLPDGTGVVYLLSLSVAVSLYGLTGTSISELPVRCEAGSLPALPNTRFSYL